MGPYLWLFRSNRPRLLGKVSCISGLLSFTDLYNGPPCLGSFYSSSKPIKSPKASIVSQHPLLNTMSTSYIVDLEAQTINGSHLPLPPTPIVVAAGSSRPAVPTEARNPLDDFFGYTLSHSSTHESRHDQRISAEVLPPYLEAPPAYQKKASSEPATLAMYLFKFGFCTFLFHYCNFSSC